MTKALLIVHGIGEQAPGQTTEKLVTGLSAALGQRLTVKRDGGERALAITALGVTVDLYEVYWADLLTREANRGALTWSTMPTLVWHPLLCRRAQLLAADEYPTTLVAAWLALLLPASLLAYPVAQGAQVFARIFDKDARERMHAGVEEMRFLERARAYADRAAHDETLLEVTLDSVAADVPNYMNSVARGEGVALEVLARFHAAMRAARAEHDDICILAHSLGTVVAYHGLTGMGQSAGDPPYAPRWLFTIGSPLEKIRFFWPWTVRSVKPSAHPEFRWINFYHRLDAVSGSLRRFAAWAPVENARLKGGGGILRSHVVYEQSPEFLGMLTEQIFGERSAPHIPWRRRLWDRAITTGENLLAPLSFVVALALGLSLMVMVLFGIPYLFTEPLRLFGFGAWAGRVSAGFSVLLIVGATVGVLLHLRDCYRTACANVAARNTEPTTK